jgi:Hsp70 protein
VAHGLGLSVGATALRAVAVGRSAVTRSPVLTRYPHRPAEVGVPSENPNLAEHGLIITDFVDRVGDPVAIVAGDGSSHRAEALVAEALQALLSTLAGGQPPAAPVGVSHPAHWSPSAVDALRRALAARPELGGSAPAVLISDAVAALTALQDDPGVPARGVIALCDVGGSGASITLADAGNGFQPIGPTVRYPDFSGDLVDQALLRRVVADVAGSGAVDLSSTSAIGNLSRLRGQCRAAKERLSTAAVTSLPVELPGRRTEVRVTRAELDVAIREPLDGFVALLEETLQRSGIRSGDLVAVASVGGGARMPILTTMLSEHLRVPVVTSAQPELAAAIGGGLKAARGLVPEVATAMASAVVAPVPRADPGAPPSSVFRALAWSDADDLPEPAEADEPQEPYEPRPQLAFTPSEDTAAHAVAAVPWYRRPVGLLAVGAVAVLAALGAAAFYALRNDDSSTTTAPSVATTTAAPSASDVPQLSSPVPSPATQAPDQTGYQQEPPPPVVTVTQEPPPVPQTPTTEAPPPPSSTDAPPVTVTEPPPSPSPTTRQPIIPTLPYQTIPGLPFVPAPVQPAQP